MSKLIVFLSAIIGICQSASISDLVKTKCAISDDACWKNIYTTVLTEAVKNGFPEMNVPILDPYVVKGLEIIPLGLLKLTIVEGQVDGIKTCTLTEFKVNVETKRANLGVSCDHLSIKGQYKVEKTPAFSAVFDAVDVHGDGNGNIDLEKVQCNVDIGFQVKKHDDGELHIEIETEDNTYKYEIDKMTVAANNVYIGTQEISGVLVNIFNENWEFMLKTFGNLVMDKILEESYKQITKFYNKVPVSQLTSDDLSAYVS